MKAALPRSGLARLAAADAEPYYPRAAPRAATGVFPGVRPPSPLERQREDLQAPKCDPGIWRTRCRCCAGCIPATSRHLALDGALAAVLGEEVVTCRRGSPQWKIARCSSIRPAASAHRLPACHPAGGSRPSSIVSNCVRRAFRSGILCPSQMHVPSRRRWANNGSSASIPHAN